MAKYTPTIGLEIHAELKTQTKMFCGCLNNPEEKHPNINVCPICLAHPGALPKMNQKAVESVLRIGMALNGDIPQFSKFDRKNYFYPDLPKGYQISQYDLPLVFGGVLKGVRLRRIHLEEDTGRLAHESNSDKTSGEHHGHPDVKSGQGYSLVDFNRAGVPLMELVTEPDLKDSNQAVEFAKELQLVLRYLGISNADMEKGQMRVEANISLMRTNMNTNSTNQISAIRGEISGDSRILGTKVEVKNINSFKAVHDAIEYEFVRQAEILDSGKKVIQETRGWDDVKKITVSQRLKEEAHDYRYFPEPDLPPLDLAKFGLNSIKAAIPELPQGKRVRFAKEFNLNPEQVEILIIDRQAARFFEESVSEIEEEDKEQGTKNKEIGLIFNYLTSDLKGLMLEQGIDFEELKITPENFADLIELISHNKVSSRSAKDILRKMLETGLDPHAILKTEGLEQVSDESELKEVIKNIIEANKSAVEDYKKGKEPALQFLVGKAMASLKGKGNPQILQKIFKEELTK